MSRRSRRRRKAKFEHYRDKFESRFESYGRSPNPKRFYRSKRERVIGGVCGGLAERFGWDPLLVRIAAVFTLMMSAVFPIIVIYVMVMIMTPYAPTAYRRDLDPEEDAFWRGVSDRPRATFSQMKYTFMELEDRLQKMERKVTSDEWRLRKEFRDLERH